MSTSTQVDTRTCVSCTGPIGFGGRLTGKRFCGSCWNTAGATLVDFQKTAPTVLAQQGTNSRRWSTLLTQLNAARIPLDYALSLVRTDCETFLERLLTNILSGRVTQREVNVFNHIADSLHVQGDTRARMAWRINRGLCLTNIADGSLPNITTPDGVILQSGERLHLDVPARYRLVRASGNRVIIPGRLLVSNTKFRFVGEGNGWELGLGKIIGVDRFTDAFDIQATQKRGSGRYFVDDGVLVAAVINLALRIASRQHVPTVKGTRAIPQAVKTAVWQRDGGQCVQCGSRTQLEYDHDIPWSKGGASSVDNLRLLCRPCNSKKGNRI